MTDSVKILYQGGEGEIIEKKSRFIAAARPVESEAEAAAFIEEIRKKYWDARHNCSAFVIGDRAELTRCSDDGEPAQTAGRPILDVIMGREVRNICVVVTRYFGGTLLGTGGLVRAYSAAAAKALDNSIVMDKIPAVKLVVHTDYNGVGKLQYLTAQLGITILDTEYTDQVVMILLVPLTVLGQIKAQITEKTNGQAVMEEQDKVYYGLAGDRVIIL